jgi:hypothetical protein
VEEYVRLFGRTVSSLEAIRLRARAKGLDRMTSREINREIKATRRELAKKNS